MSGSVFGAVGLSSGAASGPPLRLDEPLSFWGGLDPATGRIVDRWHPQRGANVTGRVLMMSAGRGSNSGSAALAEAIRAGVGPAAILLLERDPIVVVGAMVPAELCGPSALLSAPHPSPSATPSPLRGEGGTCDQRASQTSSGTETRPAFGAGAAFGGAASSASGRGGEGRAAAGP